MSLSLIVFVKKEKNQTKPNQIKTKQKTKKREKTIEMTQETKQQTHFDKIKDKVKRNNFYIFRFTVIINYLNQ